MLSKLFAQYKYLSGNKLDSINYTTARAKYTCSKTVKASRHSGKYYRDMPLFVPSIQLKKQYGQEAQKSTVIMDVFTLQLKLSISCSNKLLSSVLSVIPGNITSLLPGIVYECVARVNDAIGNERCFHGITLKMDNKKFIILRPAIPLANKLSYLATKLSLVTSHQNRF